MTCTVVDTNVVLVANGQHADVSPECVAECASRLQDIMRTGRLVLDDRFLILLEYQNKTTPKVGNRPGDAFVRWALRNSATAGRVERVPLVDHPTRGFESFPDDTDLATFDLADRKFVAVTCVHADRPPILQAVDSKWLAWNTALNRHAVVVDFLCPRDIERFKRDKGAG